MNYLRRRCTWNIQISPQTIITKLMPVSYLFPFISACWERNKISWEVTLVSLWTQTNFGGIYNNYSGLLALWWCKQNANWQHWVIPQTVPYSEQRSWKQQVLPRDNGKVRFRLNIDVRKEMEDLRLHAMKRLITFAKGRLNFSCKSTTAANVDVTETLLDNWLKNNHITVDKIYYLRSLFVFFFWRILAFKFISQPQKTGRKTESCGNSLKLDLSE